MCVCVCVLITKDVGQRVECCADIIKNLISSSEKFHFISESSRHP